MTSLNLFGHELVVDNFAGGGGASEGIEQALGRPVDLAINHDATAIAVHTANHPGADHSVADVWDIDPEHATHGQPVRLIGNSVCPPLARAIVEANFTHERRFMPAPAERAAA